MMTLEEFTNNLKRDRARGNLAPHQIILLLSIRKLILQNKSKTIFIFDLLELFGTNIKTCLKLKIATWECP